VYLRKGKVLRWEYIEILVILCDQATKYIVKSWFPLERTLPVIPHLNFSLAYNHGAAFGLLAQAGGWQRWFFVAVAIVIYAGGVWWMRRLDYNRDNLTGIGIALILGGAIGNIIDRVCYGHVIDFIDFYVGNWHWYTFNVADIAICVGAAFILFKSVRN
jgi:signal peptidase II